MATNLHRRPTDAYRHYRSNAWRRMLVVSLLINSKLYLSFLPVRLVSAIPLPINLALQHVLPPQPQPKLPLLDRILSQRSNPGGTNATRHRRQQSSHPNNLLPANPDAQASHDVDIDSIIAGLKNLQHTTTSSFHALFRQHGELFEFSDFLTVAVKVDMAVPRDICNDGSSPLFRSSSLNAGLPIKPPPPLSLDKLGRPVFDDHFDEPPGHTISREQGAIPLSLLLHRARVQADAFCLRAASWTSGFKAPSRTRPKRDFGLTALLATGLLSLAAGTAFGATSTALSSSSTTNAEFAVHWDAISHLQTFANASTKAISELEAEFRHHRKLSTQYYHANNLLQWTTQIITEFDKLERGLTAGLAGRLSLDLIPAEHLSALFRQIVAKAGAHQRTLPFTSALSLLDLPATVHPNPSGFMLELQVPLVRQRFQLAEIIPVPLFASDSTAKPLLVDVATDHRFLAVHGELSDNVPLRARDLLKCHELPGRKFICPDLVKRPSFTSTCIGALYFADTAAAASICDFTRSPHRWDVTPKDNGSYIVSSIDNIMASQSCKEDHGPVKTSSITFPAGQFPLKLRPGCSLITKHFTLSGAQRQVGHLLIDRTLIWHDLRAALANFTLQDIENAVLSIKQKGAVPPASLRALAEVMSSMPVLTPEDVAAGTSIAVIFQIIFTIIGIVAALRLSVKLAHKAAKKARNDSIHFANLHHDSQTAKLKEQDHEISQLRNQIEPPIQIPDFHKSTLQSNSASPPQVRVLWGEEAQRALQASETQEQIYAVPKRPS